MLYEVCLSLAGGVAWQSPEATCLPFQSALPWITLGVSDCTPTAPRMQAHSLAPSGARGRRATPGHWQKALLSEVREGQSRLELFTSESCLSSCPTSSEACLAHALGPP